MKKMAILLAATGLSLVGAGFGAATVLAPPPVEAPEEAMAEAADFPDGTESEISDPAGEVASKDSYEVARDRLLVRIGQVNVPVPKARSISYVVADIALKAKDPRAADTLTRVASAVRARDVILEQLHALAEKPILRGVSIDDTALGRALTDALQEEFPGVAGVVFVNLLKQDVPRI